MTATTTLPTPPSYRLSSGGVLRSELVKLATLRSTRVAALAVPVLLACGMLLRAWAYAAVDGPVGVPAGAAWQDVLTVGSRGAQLAAVVLAALAVGSEYSQRAVLTTFVAAPRRLLVGVAKVVATLVPLAVLGALGLLLGTVASLPFMAAAGLGGPAPGFAALGLAALGTVVALALLAVLVTAVLRSTAAGITVALAVLFVLPLLAAVLGGALGVDLAPVLLTYAAPMALALHDPAGAGALARDLVVTTAWVLVPGAAAALALVRRDA